MNYYVKVTGDFLATGKDPKDLRNRLLKVLKKNDFEQKNFTIQITRSDETPIKFVRSAPLNESEAGLLGAETAPQKARQPAKRLAAKAKPRGKISPSGKLPRKPTKKGGYKHVSLKGHKPSPKK